MKLLFLTLSISSLLSQTNVRVTGAAPSGVATISREASNLSLTLISKPTILNGNFDLTLKSNTGLYANTKYLVVYSNGDSERWTVPSSPLTTTRSAVKGETASSGSTPTSITWVSEVPSGPINDSNRSFTISKVPVESSIFLFLNGIFQELNSDFEINGKDITFKSTSIPQTGDSLRIRYVEVQ